MLFLNIIKILNQVNFEKKSNINRLTKALNNAINKENYEVAAKIRDKIKLIKNT